MKVFLAICRIFVGTLFVISGMIKANDPLGFSYKMEEYFTVFKLTDSIADTSYTIRDLSAEEVSKVVDGLSTIKPVDYEGNPIIVTDSTSKSEFMYTKERVISMRSEERKHWFNSFCDWMHDRALMLSIITCILEILLGIAVIAGFYMRLSSWLLLGMILFFTFLTFYSAYYNKVTDCGCFGDALKLKPWESFIKDLVLLVFIIPIFIKQGSISGAKFDSTEKVISAASLLLGAFLSLYIFDWYLPAALIGVLVLVRAILAISIKKEFMTKVITLTLTLILSTGFTVFCYFHLPVKDYRPWKPGTSIPSKMIPTPEVANVYMLYKNKKTGEVKEYLAVKVDENGKSSNDFSWMTENFINENEFVNQKKDVIKPFVEAPIHDFTLDDPDSGESYAQTFIHNPGYKFMLVAYDISKTNIKVQSLVNEFAAACEQNKIEFIGATSSRDKIEEFRHEHQNAFKYYINDATSLKTIIRSNPGLVMIKDTVVIDMWHYNDFPKFEDVKAKMK